MISEGTNIKNVKSINIEDSNGESYVENQIEDYMNKYDGTVFVLCSSANDDRVNAVRKAAQNSGRLICEDLFMTVMRNGAEEKAQSFQWFYIDEKTPRTYKYFEKLYNERKLVSAESLSKIQDKKVIFVRASMIPFMRRYLSNISSEEKNVLIYSMWNGYKVSKSVKEILAFCDEQGIDVVDLHVSGHSYRNGILKFIDSLEPKTLIPIHCDKDDREEFLRVHNNCKMLLDGEEFLV